jgi:hypothetical protein
VHGLGSIHPWLLWIAWLREFQYDSCEDYRSQPQVNGSCELWFYSRPLLSLHDVRHARREKPCRLQSPSRSLVGTPHRVLQPMLVHSAPSLHSEGEGHSEASVLPAPMIVLAHAGPGRTGRWRHCSSDHEAALVPCGPQGTWQRQSWPWLVASQPAQNSQELS